MRDANGHLTPEMLDGLADGSLDAEARAEAAGHLVQCAACAGEAGRLRALLQEVAALPRSLEPPAGQWDAVRGRLLARQAARRVRWGGPAQWLLAAAIGAILLIPAIRLVRGIDRDESPVAAAPNDGPALASLVALEPGYAAAERELRETLAARRDRLQPETVATLERSLRAIDEAMREARTALARDPANQTLLDILAAQHEQKLGLLRQATQLSVDM